MRRNQISMPHLSEVISSCLTLSPLVVQQTETHAEHLSTSSNTKTTGHDAHSDNSATAKEFTVSSFQTKRAGYMA